jgi:kinesin family protein C2/C3
MPVLIILEMSMICRVVQAVEPLIPGKLENKLPNNVTHTVKEGGNTSMPEFRRSRSTPRGKYMILP